MFKSVALVILGAVALGAQSTPQYDGSAVRISQGPNDKDYTTKFGYTAGGLLEYQGKASRVQPEFSWNSSTATLTSIVVASNVGTVTTSTDHGLTVGNKVTIAGVLADTDLNGTYYVQSTATTTTFTITTASVSNGTYSASGITLKTTAPRTTAAIWHITWFRYDGSSRLTDQLNSDFAVIWDDRAVTTGSTKVNYQ